jgi:hypothetical protein
VFVDAVSAVKGVYVRPEFGGGKSYGYIPVFAYGSFLRTGRPEKRNRNPHFVARVAAGANIAVKNFPAAPETVCQKNLVTVFGQALPFKKLHARNTLGKIGAVVVRPVKYEIFIHGWSCVLE